MVRPSFFSKRCGMSGLFSFIVKDLLEFVGLIGKDNLRLADRMEMNDYEMERMKVNQQKLAKFKVFA